MGVTTTGDKSRSHNRNWGGGAVHARTRTDYSNRKLIPGGAAQLPVQLGFNESFNQGKKQSRLQMWRVRSSSSSSSVKSTGHMIRIANKINA